MYILWRLILVLLLTAVGLCSTARTEANNSRTDSEELAPEQQPSIAATLKNDEQLPVQPPKGDSTVRVKRDTTNDDSSSPFWSWLTGRENPDPCMMASVGGVIGGGALTGAFVGAGIGSIFTGPGTVIGAVVGGVAGLFGGASIGHRAGAAVCAKPCITVDDRELC